MIIRILICCFIPVNFIDTFSTCTVEISYHFSCNMTINFSRRNTNRVIIIEDIINFTAFFTYKMIVLLYVRIVRKRLFFLTLIIVGFTEVWLSRIVHQADIVSRKDKLVSLKQDTVIKYLHSAPPQQ